MKRSQVVFVTVVFTALFTGLVMEWTRRSDPFEVLTLPPPRAVPLEELDAPHGDQRVSGRVEDPNAGGVAGVLVRLTPLDDPEREDEALPLSWTVTDEAGHFSLEELVAGSYRATLLLPGREVVRLELSVPAEGELHWLIGEPRPPAPDLEELRRETLRGLVRDAQGRPLAGLEVVCRPAPDTSPLSGALVRRVRTDRSGGFAFEGLALASYRVELLPEWARGGSWPVLVGTSITHDEGSAEVPLELVFEPASVSGRLLDEEQRPLEGALVQLWSASDEDHVWPAVQSGADGVFRLEGLPAGSYALRIRAGAAAVSLAIVLERGENRRLELEALHPGLALSGG